jgi:hypothetical protein
MNFWNRRVNVIHELFPLAMCCMTQHPARVDTASGQVVLAGESRAPEYIVVIPPANLQLQGTVIGRHKRAVLYRVTNPLRVRSR